MENRTINVGNHHLFQRWVKEEVPVRRNGQGYRRREKRISVTDNRGKWARRKKRDNSQKKDSPTPDLKRVRGTCPPGDHLEHRD